MPGERAVQQGDRPLEPHERQHGQVAPEGSVQALRGRQPRGFPGSLPRGTIGRHRPVDRLENLLQTIMTDSLVASIEKRTFCRICPVNCGLIAQIADDRIVRVRGDRSNALSAGYLCPKGRAAGDAHHSSKRLNRPMMRQHGTMHAADWSLALADLAGKLEAIKASSG